MSIPLSIVCDSFQSRLTVKSEKLLGKRVACPKCQTPIFIRDPNAATARTNSVPVGHATPLEQAVPEILSSAGGGAMLGNPSSETSGDLALPPMVPTNATAPTPVSVNVVASGGTPGLPVIHEAPRPSKTTKQARGTKKRKLPAKSLWLLGLAGVGSVAGLLTLLLFMVGSDDNPPSNTSPKRPMAAGKGLDRYDLDGASPAPAPDGVAPPSYALTPPEIVKAVGDAIVCITITDQAGQEVALGTGVLFDSSGLLVTNYHVIENAAVATVHFRGGERREIAGYRAADAVRDLAILQLADSTEPTPFLRLNPIADVQQGDAVFALGHPAGLEFTLTNGIVSSKRLTSELPAQYQQYLKAPPDQQWIQTSAAISGGSSGGPLLSARGELVGINTWVAEGANLGFAIHVRHLIDLINDLGDEVSSLPVKPQPKAYRPTDPLVVDLWRQFQADFEEFAVRLRRADREMASAVFEAYNPAAKSMRSFLELAEAHRGQPSALEALTAVCSLSRWATRSSTLTTAAYDRLVEDHVDDANLRAAIVAAASAQDPAARTFLGCVLEQSSNRELQGIAAFALAGTLLSNASVKNDTEEQATQLLNRVVREFGDIPWETATLGEIAEQTLFAAQHLMIGRPALEVAGVDEHGDELNLSDYRGKVVVLDFWADWCPHCRVMYPQERVLVEEYDGRPFALLGVNVDAPNRFKAVTASGAVTWRSCWDGPQGPIAERWQVDSFPTIYVLDHKGIIRFKGLRDQNLAAAVQLLVNLAEVEAIIAQDPDNQQHLMELARCYGQLADAYASLEEWPAAIGQWQAAADCFRQLTESNTKNAQFRRDFATALIRLGQSALRSHDLTPAAEAFDEASAVLQVATSSTANSEDRALLLDVVSQLGKIAQWQGDYVQAVRQLEVATQLAPESATPLNALAWLLATCPDDAIRDGDQAVRLATKACELTQWASYAHVDTLAAALAEQGQFQQAVQQQRKAVRLAPTALHSSMNARVRLYQDQLPYRLDRPSAAERSNSTKERPKTPADTGHEADPAASSPSASEPEAMPPSISPPETAEQAVKRLREIGV